MQRCTGIQSVERHLVGIECHGARESLNHERAGIGAIDHDEVAIDRGRIVEDFECSGRVCRCVELLQHAERHDRRKDLSHVGTSVREQNRHLLPIDRANSERVVLHTGTTRGDGGRAVVGGCRRQLQRLRDRLLPRTVGESREHGL